MTKILNRQEKLTNAYSFFHLYIYLILILNYYSKKQFRSPNSIPPLFSPQEGQPETIDPIHFAKDRR